tara:strand:- start:61 stop:1833 length:1773 start_codon:yes stop_codon:yes gene_type:complete
MAFQVSPGVAVKEIDLTNVIPAVSTSIGGFAGYFNSGPISEIRLIGSETELAEVFGKPNSAITRQSFYQAASFLKYGNALKVVRASNASGKNAHSDSTADPVLIDNSDTYELAATTAYNANGAFVAKSAGVLGNAIKVTVVNSAIFNDNRFDSASLGFIADGTSASGVPVVSSKLGQFSGTAELAADEIHIVVEDSTGAISGTAGTILEVFEYVSTTAGALKDNGESNNVRDILLQGSNYIYAGNLTTIAGFADDTTLSDVSTVTNFDAKYTSTVNGVVNISVDIEQQLSEGADTASGTPGDITLALDLLADAETEDVNLLFAHVDGNGDNTIGNKLTAIASDRKDCVAFVSPPIADSTSTTPREDVTAYKNSLSAPDSYSVIDSSSLKIYDKYNDVYELIPASGFMAGLCANTDSVAEPWFSPAGFNRGQLRGVTKLVYNPKKADRDELYKNNINPISAFPGQGIVLFGDKTLQSKPSAFDRINVRRLFIVLEKAIATAAKFQLFELNDEFTRAMFRNMTEPFLRDVKGRRGITDFLVVCDETNNTGQVIDTNRFVADIYIKPARSINFITLNFIATRTGVEFSEIVGK